MPKYLLYEVALPGIFVSMIWWPGQMLGLEAEPFLFLKVFASGDLLPICLLILIGAFFKTERVAETLAGQIYSPAVAKAAKEAAKLQMRQLKLVRGWVFFIGFMLLLTYMTIKISVLPYPFPANGSGAVKWWLYLCTGIDIFVFAAAAGFGCWAARFETD